MTSKKFEGLLKVQKKAQLFDICVWFLVTGTIVGILFIVM